MERQHKDCQLERNERISKGYRHRSKPNRRSTPQTVQSGREWPKTKVLKSTLNTSVIHFGLCEHCFRVSRVAKFVDRLRRRDHSSERLVTKKLKGDLAVY